MKTGNPTFNSSTQGPQVEKPKGIEGIDSRINEINIELSRISKKAQEELFELQDSGGSQDDYFRISDRIGAENAELVSRLRQELKDLEESRAKIESETVINPKSEHISEETWQALTDDQRKAIAKMPRKWEVNPYSVGNPDRDKFESFVPDSDGYPEEYKKYQEAIGVVNSFEFREWAKREAEKKRIGKEAQSREHDAKRESTIATKAREAGMTLEEYRAKRKDEDQKKIEELRKKLGANG